MKLPIQFGALLLFCGCVPAATPITAFVPPQNSLLQFCGSENPLKANSIYASADNTNFERVIISSSKSDPYISEFYAPSSIFYSTVKFQNEVEQSVRFQTLCEPKLLDRENLEFWGLYHLEGESPHPARIIINYYSTYIYLLGFPELSLYQKPSNINSTQALFVSNDGGAYRGTFNEVIKAYENKSYTNFGIVSRMASVSHKLLYRDIPRYVWDGNTNEGGYSSGGYGSSGSLSLGGCSGYCPVHVSGYLRANGTYVAPYDRSRPGK